MNTLLFVATSSVVKIYAFLTMIGTNKYKINFYQYKLDRYVKHYIKNINTCPNETCVFSCTIRTFVHFSMYILVCYTIDI